MSTPSQEPTPTAPHGETGDAPDLRKGGAAASPGSASPAAAEDAPSAEGERASGGAGAAKPAAPRSPAQDRRVSIGLGIIVVGVVAALVFDLALASSIPPLAASLITLIIGVVGGAVLGRPSRAARD